MGAITEGQREPHLAQLATPPVAGPSRHLVPHVLHVKQRRRGGRVVALPHKERCGQVGLRREQRGEG